MLAATEKKKDADFTEAVDALLPLAILTAQKGNVQAAIDSILPLEKQSRTAADQASNTRLLNAIVSLCGDGKKYKLLNDMIVLLAKKHGFLKHAVQAMVQTAMSYIAKLEGTDKTELIDTIRTVTDGKIFLEVERARVTRILSKLHETNGNPTLANSVLQELQVETFGSMEKREKTDFILEQMRLCLGELDYSRTLLLSKKIHSKFFQVVENQDLLLRFCKLMITHALAEANFLAVAKYYAQIYATNEVKDNVAEWTPVLQNMVLYTCLASFDNEQSDMINRVYLDVKLTTIPLYKDFVKCFITKELIRWSAVTEIYAAFRKGAALSSSDAKGVERWGALKMRVTDHNIRVVSGYYSCITVKRLGELLDLPGSEVELRISDLVSKGTIWGKIDRVEGVVKFEKEAEGVEDVLNVWSAAVGGVLGLIGKTGHLISKEEIAARVFV